MLFSFLPNRSLLTKHDGSHAQDGSTREGMWRGMVPYDILPHCAIIDVETSEVFVSGRGGDQKFGLVYFPAQWKML